MNLAEGVGAEISNYVWLSRFLLFMNYFATLFVRARRYPRPGWAECTWLNVLTLYHSISLV